MQVFAVVCVCVFREFAPLPGVNLRSAETNCPSSSVILLSVIVSVIVLKRSLRLMEQQ